TIDADLRTRIGGSDDRSISSLSTAHLPLLSPPRLRPRASGRIGARDISRAPARRASLPAAGLVPHLHLRDRIQNSSNLPPQSSVPCRVSRHLRESAGAVTHRRDGNRFVGAPRHGSIGTGGARDSLVKRI